MVDLYFIVKGTRLRLKQGPYRIKGNSTSDFVCHFKFEDDDPIWNNATKIAVFKSMSFNIVKVVPLDSNNSCVVPWEISCKPGVVICAITGNIIDNDAVISKVTTDPAQVLLSLGRTGDDTENYSTTPSPSQYQQFILDVTNSIEDYFNAHNFSYDDLNNIPSIEGVQLIGDLDIDDFGYQIASVYDIDAMFN